MSGEITQEQIQALIKASELNSEAMKLNSAAMTSLAESNKALANSTEHEIDAMKKEHDSFKETMTTAIEKLTESAATTTQKLSESIHEMSKTVQETSLRSEHIREELTERKKDAETLSGVMQQMAMENSQRDGNVKLLEQKVETVQKDIELGFSALNTKLDNKGKWFAENWSKLITTVFLVGSLIVGVAVTLNKVNEGNNGTSKSTGG